MSTDSFNKNDQAWLKAVKSSLENYQEPFNPSWEKLEKELNAAPAPHINIFRNNIFRYASAVAAAIAVKIGRAHV